MLNRKLHAAALVCIPAGSGLAFYTYIFDAAFGADLVLALLISFSFMLPILFTYGVAASALAEAVSRFAGTLREPVSFLTHLLLGAGFILPFSLYSPAALDLPAVNIITVNGVIWASVFYMTDLVLRRKVY